MTITAIAHLSEGGTRAPAPVQELPAHPPAEPPSREHGWAQAAEPPANLREWETAEPVIPPGQCRAETIPACPKLPIESVFWHRRQVDRLTPFPVAVAGFRF